MTFIPPQTITIKSDSNRLELLRTAKGKEVSYIYTYVNSSTKKGLELPLTEAGIKKLIKRELILCK